MASLNSPPVPRQLDAFVRNIFNQSSLSLLCKTAKNKAKYHYLALGLLVLKL